MRLAAFLVTGFVGSAAFAVDEPFCVVPENCVDDLIGLRFPGGAADLAGVCPGEEITLEVFLDVKSEHLQGFSYTVVHDTSLLEILSATHEGADPLIVEAARNGGGTRIPPERLYFIQVIPIFTASDPTELPVRDGYLLAKARYRVNAPIPAAGTKLSFSNDTRCPNCPPVATNFTISGKTKQPRIVRNAIAGAAPADCPSPDFAFFFGPRAASEAFDIAGARRLPITLRNAAPVLGFSLGVREFAGSLTFASGLSTPPVELVITRSDGSEVSGDSLVGNTAKGAPRINEFTQVEKGGALAGITGDFFAASVAPVSGELTVGYVTDVTANGRVIPPSPAGGDPPIGNEILLVSFEFPGISRGDANGDGRINVTDGVLVTQNIFANRFVVFDCRDMLDANDDGVLSTADPVVLLTYVFLKGPTLPAPFLACSDDPTPDALGCNQVNCR